MTVMSVTKSAEIGRVVSGCRWKPVWLGWTTISCAQLGSLGVSFSWVRILISPRFGGAVIITGGAAQPPAARTSFVDMSSLPSLISAIARIGLWVSTRRRVCTSARPLSGVR